MKPHYIGENMKTARWYEVDATDPTDAAIRYLKAQPMQTRFRTLAVKTARKSYFVTIEYHDGRYIGHQLEEWLP
jgi:hypothetical protein